MTSPSLVWGDDAYHCQVGGVDQVRYRHPPPSMAGSSGRSARPPRSMPWSENHRPDAARHRLRLRAATGVLSRSAATDSIAGLNSQKSFRFLFCRARRTADAPRPQQRISISLTRPSSSILSAQGIVLPRVAVCDPIEHLRLEMCISA